MDKLSPQQSANARDIESLLSQHVSNHGQLPISKALDIDKDAFNRLIGNKNGIGLKQLSELLSILNLKIIDVGEVICPEHCTPIPDEDIISAFIGMRDAYGTGPRIRRWQEQLMSLQLLDLTDDGRIILPKGFRHD